MKISIIAAGNKMPAWVDSCCKEYIQRLPHEMDVSIREVAIEKRRKSQSVEKLRQLETQRLIESVPANDLVVVLDEKGQAVTTQKLAAKLKDWQIEARNVSFLIGGPDGFDFSLIEKKQKKLPDWRWSLSELTFPHPMVRVILAEQIYRAWSILAGHPYHRD